MLSTPRRVTALAAGALLLVGCGGNGDAEPATELTVVGTDALDFEPDTVTVPAGEEVTVELTSEGVEHDLVIEDAADVAHTGDEGHGDHGDDEVGEDQDERDTELRVAHADAGESVTATFQIDAVGTYEIYCGVPGHREAGMTATLEVTDSA